MIPAELDMLVGRSGWTVWHASRAAPMSPPQALNRWAQLNAVSEDSPVQAPEAALVKAYVCLVLAKAWLGVWSVSCVNLL